MTGHLAPARLARLALEPGGGNRHLSQCTQCQQQLATFRAAIDTMKRASQPPEEAPFAPAKAIAAAVSAVAEAEGSGLDVRAWFQRPTAWVLAAIPVAVLAVAVWWPRAMPADGFRLISGAPLISARSIDVAPNGPAAIIALSDGTRIQGDPGTRFEILTGARVTLAKGRVQLWVTKRPSSPLRVETAEASVRVVGTIFSVSRVDGRHVTQVEVSEGLVEVTGRSLPESRRLGVGESLDVAVAGDEPVVSTSAPAPEPEANQEPVRKEPTRVPTRKRKLDIERVRSRVRAGQFAEARTLLNAERANAQSQSDTAELDIVEAEMLLATGRRDEALAAYLTVSERHRSLRQGEAALFAAVQLSLPNDRARATELLKRSLERYPTGRFHQEATDLLAALKNRSP